MTSTQLAELQREFLIKTEKQSAILLDAEFERLKREISAYLLNNLTPETRRAVDSFLREFLAFSGEKIEGFSGRVGRVVSRAQNRVINFAADSLQKFLPEVRTSIFAPDRAAIQKLIGRTQTGETLSKIFARLKPVVVERAKQNLIESFALGEPVEQTARRLESATGAERFRVLTISRNETVMAYRNASVEFFDNAGIIEYRFLSILDARTCFICWRLHGTKWKLKIKPHIHTQCRCCIVPVLKRDGEIKIGIELFSRLEKGVQKQILGNKRFVLFENGNSLDSFVGVKKSADFGQSYFMKPLADFEF